MVFSLCHTIYILHHSFIHSFILILECFHCTLWLLLLPSKNDICTPDVDILYYLSGVLYILYTNIFPHCPHYFVGHFFYYNFMFI